MFCDMCHCNAHSLLAVMLHALSATSFAQKALWCILSLHSELFVIGEWHSAGIQLGVQAARLLGACQKHVQTPALFDSVSQVEPGVAALLPAV